MKFVYPAVIIPKENGYHAYFPDLAMCEADGDTLDEVLRRAREAMYNWIDLELSEEDPDLPYMKDPEEYDLPEGAFVRNVMITYRFHVGWDE